MMILNRLVYKDERRAALVVIHKCLREAVVLAGMPEPRHREVKLRVTQIPVPSMALDTGIPAGMTTLKYTCV
jgi:hypothetical protein